MNKKIPFNPNEELFRWGPALMRFYFNSDFEGILTRLPIVFPGEYWPHGLFISKGANMVWVNGYPEINKCGRSIFLHHMLPKKARKKVWEGWLEDLKLLETWEKKIDAIKPSGLSEKDFISLWFEMKEVLLSFWTHILVPELGNYGADTLLEEELRKFIKNKNEISIAMEILTSPEEPSFFQQEEIDLFKARDLAKHAKKYSWLRNSYNETEVLPVSFFEERKRELKDDPERIFKKKQKEVRKNKLDLKKKYKLPKKVMDIADAFVKGVEWQDARKAVIWVYLYYKDLMITEAAKRLKVAKNDLLNFGTGEILEMLNGRKVSKSEIKNRRVAFTAVMDVLKKPVMVSGDIALKYWDLYAEDKLDKHTDEIKGIVVSRSAQPVRGKVHVILDPKNVGSFKDGEILVAPMTTPEYIFVMKKASAVITDIGGLMSHAAIVSRELGIPCIVGTKVATRALKDGDMVEVDTNAGIVKNIR